MNANALKKLQQAGETKPYFGFSKLPMGYHEIIGFRLTKNKFAKKDECKKTILVELKEQIVFLPKYFSENIKEEDINDLNSDGETKYLFFGGKRENRYVYSFFFFFQPDFFSHLFSLFFIALGFSKL